MEKFSFFTSASNPIPKFEYDISQLANGIKSNDAWKAHVESLRKYLDAGIEKKYRDDKRNLMAFTPCGTFTHRSNRSLSVHSRIICMDYDFKSAEQAMLMKKSLSQIPSCVMAFISPSGAGLKAFFRISHPTNEGNHHLVWEALNRHVKELLSSISATADERAKALAVLCFISHDESVYFNPDAERFDWKEVVTIPAVLNNPDSKPLPPSDITFSGTVPQWLSDALSHIPCDDYSVWLAVGSALKHGGYPMTLWDEWSQSSDKYNATDIAYKWKAGFDRIPFEYIERTATRTGWTPPWGSIARVVLHPEPVSADDGWHDHQQSLNKAFQSDAKFVLIRSDAGTGKDYAKASYILDTPANEEKFVETVPRILLGQEKITALLDRSKADREVFLWQGILTGWETYKSRPWHERTNLLGKPQGLMCIQAPKYSALWRKGVNPQRQLCPICPSLLTCNQFGYRSQTRKAEESDYLLSAQDGLLFNPELQGFAKRIIGKVERQKTAIIDEVRAHELFSECELPKNALQFIIDAWTGTTAGRFAQDILESLEFHRQPDIQAVKERVLNLSELERHQIIQSFSRFRIFGQALTTESDKVSRDGILKAYGTFYPEYSPAGIAIALAINKEAADELNDEGVHAIFIPTSVDKVILLDYSQAIAFKFFQIPDTDDDRCIQDIPESFPRLYSEFWTPIHQLESLFTQYPRIQDTPISYHAGVLKFNLPPVPHPSIDKFVLMSATAETQIIRENIFPDYEIDEIETGYTQWESGNSVYQIRTGKYPRQSVLSTDGELIGFGRKALDALISESTSQPDKQFTVITYKSVEDNYADTTPSNVTFAHYGAVEGENQRFQNTDSFWIMFDPRLPPHEVKHRAQLYYGRDVSPLNYEYSENGYIDTRLQRISDQYAEAELIQAIGRARLVRRSGVEVIIMCGRDIKGVSGRDETVLFDLADLHKAGSVANLRAAVTEREQSESQALADINAMLSSGGSIQAVQNHFGISERAMRNIRPMLEIPTVAEKKSASADLKEQAIAMRAEGMTIRAIATKLGVSKGSVSSYLKKI